MSYKLVWIVLSFIFDIVTLIVVYEGYYIYISL